MEAICSSETFISLQTARPYNSEDSTVPQYLLPASALYRALFTESQSALRDTPTVYVHVFILTL
jgi:hypothetical protein